MQSVVPYLWFDHQAEEAVEHYLSIFKEGKIKSVSRIPDTAKVMTISFVLNEQEFIAMNGGPHYTFSPAISFCISCKTQEEVDHYWDRLSEGGEPGKCGWLKDRYGVSWQVVPKILGELMTDSNPEKVQRVTQVMLKMTKLNIEELSQA